MSFTKDRYFTIVEKLRRGTLSREPETGLSPALSQLQDLFVDYCHRRWDQVLAESEFVEIPEIRGDILFLCAGALFQKGQYNAASDAYAEALASRGGECLLFSPEWIPYNQFICRSHLPGFRFGQELPLLRRARTAAHDSQNPALSSLVLTAYANRAFNQGRFERASSLYEQAIRDHERSSSAALNNWLDAASGVARSALMQGRASNAQSWMDKMSERLFGGQESSLRDRLERCYAEFYLHTGRPEETLLHLRMCTAEATPLEKIQGLLLKAEALLALGKDGVGQAIEEATKLAAHLQLPPDTIPDFDLVRARCLIAEGRHADAYRSLWRAETVARRLKSPFFETEVLALKSQLTKEEGDLQSAQALLTQALEVCRRHDYPLLEARLTKQVRALRDSLPAGFRFVVSRDQAEVQLLDDRVVRNSFKTYQLSGKLLQEFLRRPNVDIPVDELHERIWGTPIRNESHLTKIKTSVSRLRAQLKESEAPVDLVSQEYGSYRIVCRIPVQEEA